MALTEREELELAVAIVRDWTIKRTCSEIENLFYELRSFNQSENADLWKDLRSEMNANNALLDDQLQFYVNQPVLATNGWWWYDPNLWKENEV